MMKLKTWVAVNKKAVQHNIAKFRSILAPKTKLFAVVKSNAYGHGLVLFSQLADQYGVDPHTKRALMQKKNGARYGVGVDGFCVDSVIEGERLRKEGIKKPILVLGPTFKYQLATAAKNSITVTVSNFDALAELIKSRQKPDFHLKIDTGMHRQGFYVSELSKAIRIISNSKFKISNLLKGVYTHFASAKDINYPTLTENQFTEFQKALKLLEKSGFKSLIKHCAATGGALVNPKYHLDAVRIGIGLYGLYPSAELMIQSKLKLKPALSWRSVVSEVKNIQPGDYVGYDLTERIEKKSQLAIVPIGYWHGYPRALSGIGEVIVCGKRARVLGRVSMDMIAIDIGGAKAVRGNKVTLLGKNGAEEISVYELARKLGASHYEIITRINPLIERVSV